MTDRLIEKKVARAIALDKLIAAHTEELKDIKRELIELAKIDADGQTQTEGGGWSYIFRDPADNIARVTQPGDKLKSRIDPEAKTFAKIKEAAGRSFMQLFIQRPVYEPIEDFRVKALSLLVQPEAKKLIRLVTTESSPQVAFETKESA